MNQTFWQKIRAGERDAAIALAGIVLAIYLVIISVGAILGLAYVGKSPEYQMQLPVSGKGEVMAVPDIASFNFSVVETGVNIGEVQGKATTKNNAIIDYLKSRGVESRDIKTDGYSLYPKYEYNPTSGESKLVGYEVNQTVTVKVRKAADAGEILSEVGTRGVSNISGLTFTIDDTDSLKRQARDLAIEDAKEQAKILAKKLGVNLGDIVSYYEMEQYPTYPMYDAYAGSSMMKEQAAVAPTVEVGEQTITSNVTVSFEIK